MTWRQCARECHDHHVHGKLCAPIAPRTILCTLAKGQGVSHASLALERGAWLFPQLARFVSERTKSSSRPRLLPRVPSTLRLPVQVPLSLGGVLETTSDYDRISAPQWIRTTDLRLRSKQHPVG
jgi:hypothetical protein